LSSVSCAGLLSLLILAAGAEASPTFAPVHLADETASFELRHLAEVLQRIGGSAGVSCFAVGLYGAGISSALTVPLGSALAVEDLLGWRATPQPGEKRGASWATGGRACLQCAIVLLGMVPSLLRLPTMGVILAAQIVNGRLLPSFWCPCAPREDPRDATPGN